MQKQISPKAVAVTFGVLVLLFVVAFYIFAWQEPTAPPPGDNVSAPINVGPYGQTKEGTLRIMGSFSADNYAYLSILGGTTYVGTTTNCCPSTKLRVAGTTQLGLYGNLELYDTTTEVTIQSNGQAFSFWNTALKRAPFYISSSGNIGIWTSSFSSTPGVTARFVIEQGTTTYAPTQIQGAETTFKELRFRDTTSGETWKWSHSPNSEGNLFEAYYYDTTNNWHNPAISIQPNGFVGIATRAPGALLEIATSTRFAISLRKTASTVGSVNIFPAVGVSGTSRTGTALCQTIRSSAVCLGHWNQSGSSITCSTATTSARALCTCFGD